MQSDGYFITLSNQTIEITNKGESKNFSLDVLTKKFFQNRDFTFASFTMPKVTTYVSKSFMYKKERYGFLIYSMSPSFFAAGEKSTFVPWTHCLSLVNLSKNIVTSTALFFSSEQIKDPDTDKIYVPKVSNSRINKNLQKILGANIDLVSHEDSFNFEKNGYRKLCSEIRNQLLTDVLINFHGDVPLIENIELLKDNLNNFYTDQYIVIKDLVDFIDSKDLKSFTFYDLIEDIYNNAQPMPENKKKIKDVTAAKVISWDSVIAVEGSNSSSTLSDEF